MNKAMRAVKWIKDECLENGHIVAEAT